MKMVIAFYQHRDEIWKSLFGLILLLLFSVTTTTVNARNYIFKQISIPEGLSHLTVYSVYQDTLGNLWFGTRQGLNRYYGTSVDQIVPDKEPASLTSHVVRRIEGDKKGSIYFRLDESLVKYSLEFDKCETLVDGGVDDFVLLQDKIWFLSHDELVRIDALTGEKNLLSRFPSEKVGTQETMLLHNNALWVALRNGVMKFDPETGEQHESILDDYKVVALMADSQKRMWAGTESNGAFLLSRAGDVIKHIDFTNEEIRCFEEDSRGTVWAGTFSGLVEIDVATFETTRHFSIEKMPNTLSHSSVYALYSDEQGTMWVGTYYGGVNYFNPGKDVFNVFRPSSFHENHLSFPIVGNITEGKKGNLWICTEGGGLNKLDPITGDIQVFRSEDQSDGLLHDNLKAILYDSLRNRLYIGTHTGGLSVLDLGTLNFNNYHHQRDLRHSIPNDVVNDLAFLEDQLLIATQSGVSLMDLESGEINGRLKDIYPEIGHALFPMIFVDSQRRIWLPFFDQGVRMFDPSIRELKIFRNSKQDTTSLPRFRIVDIFEDSKGRVFFSTEGAGLALFNEDGNDFTVFTPENSGLPGSFCLNLAEAPSGDLLVSSFEGLTFFNVETRQARFYSIHRELPLDGIIEENGLFVASDQRIYVGGINGMISFTEEALDSTKADYNLYLTKLYVNNKEVVPGDESHILNKALPYADGITLNHRQTNINISFATSNHIQHLKKDFEYKLEGFDEKWISTNGHNITYTNLGRGDYTLRIREKLKKEGEPKTVGLNIRVNPPYYASALAYIIYGLLFISLVTGIILFNRSKALLRASLQIERKEKQQIKTLNQSKLKFFTNISHEFRTPLTLIVSHTDLVDQMKDLSPLVQSNIKKIKKHAERLRHMINELLDFQKHEQGEIKLHVEQIELIAFLNDIYLAFKDYAQMHQIQFRLDYPEEKIEIWCDPYQMQKVFFNLLSNAFRFTSKDQLVAIEVGKKSHSVVVRIKDTGKGIDKDELNRIFDRFYQAENISSPEDLKMSSGIGLALSKSLVDMHGGSISVESTKGEGSTFTVELPFGQDHFSEEQMRKSDIKDALCVDQVQAGEIPKDHETVLENAEDKDKPTILIVEDNEDLLAVLKELFSPIYNVETALNGEEGLEKTLKLIPNIVLSDVMMARMSGTELCQKIKTNYETSHIPVVLLTALNDPTELRKGLRKGADDYIMKPFDSENLIIRCNNLVTSRARLKERFSGIESDEKVVLASDHSDKVLLDKINSIVEDNFMNQSFNVDVLASEAGMGRSKLYTKIKDITGHTPNGYIMELKMNKAMYYLKNDKSLSVSEIGFKLGFSSARYFSVCFKDHFGMAPSRLKTNS